MSKPRVTDAKIAEALRAAGGMVTVAAKQLGYCRKQVWERMQKNPALQQIVEDEREGMVDIAEGALKRAVIAGEAWAVCFALKCQGKKRGYVERQEREISGPDGGPMQVQQIDWERVRLSGRESTDPVSERLTLEAERLSQLAPQNANGAVIVLNSGGGNGVAGPNGTNGANGNGRAH